MIRILQLNVIMIVMLIIGFNIVSDLNGGTQTDEEFCKVFTKRVFKLFGTKYTSKGIVEEYEDRYVDSELNRLRAK